MAVEPVVPRVFSWTSLCESVGTTPQLVTLHDTQCWLKSAILHKRGSNNPVSVLKLSADFENKNAPLALIRYNTGLNCFQMTVYHVNPTTRMLKAVGENELSALSAIRQKLDSPKKLLVALLRLATPELVHKLASTRGN